MTGCDDKLTLPETATRAVLLPLHPAKQMAINPIAMIRVTMPDSFFSQLVRILIACFAHHFITAARGKAGKQTGSNLFVDELHVPVRKDKMAATSP